MLASAEPGPLHIASLSVSSLCSSIPPFSSHPLLAGLHGGPCFTGSKCGQICPPNHPPHYTPPRSHPPILPSPQSSPPLHLSADPPVVPPVDSSNLDCSPYGGLCGEYNECIVTDGDVGMHNCTLHCTVS